MEIVEYSDLFFGNRAYGQPLPRELRGQLEAGLGIDLADIRVHLGAQATRRGARAFAHGTDLYFEPGQYRPDDADGVALLVHELVHVVQQSAGPQGLDRSDASTMWVDAHEEALADAVGDSFIHDRLQARALLRQVCPGTVRPTPHTVRWDRLQPNVHVVIGGKDNKLTDVDKAMLLIQNGISDHEIAAGFIKLKAKIRPVLNDWIKSSRRLVKRFVAGRDERTVRYQSWDSIARALLGEVRSKGSREIEHSLAIWTQDSSYVKETLDDYIEFVSDCLGKPEYSGVRKTILPTVGWYSKAYSHWYPSGGIKRILSAPAKCDLKQKIAGIHDLVEAFGKYDGEYDDVPPEKCQASALVPNGARGYKTVKAQMLTEDDDLTFRVGSLSSKDCTLVEDNEIIRSYRDKNIPVGFGPSFTTGRTVQCCYKLCEDNGKIAKQTEWINAIAWGLFAFWNLHYERRYSRCHSFHEAMDMANNYGVPYTPFQYPMCEPNRADPYPPGEQF